MNTLQKNTNNALHYLATQMMNQAGETWEDCCNSAERTASRLRANGISEGSIAPHLYAEAYRFENV